MVEYKLSQDGRYITRSSDHLIMLWDTKLDKPLDMKLDGETWTKDGSPKSTPWTPPVLETISQGQFMTQLARTRKITWDEANGYLSAGVVPKIFADAIAKIPIDQYADAREEAESRFIGATEFDRHNPLTITLAQLIGWSDAEVDALWAAASLIK